MVLPRQLSISRIDEALQLVYCSAMRVQEQPERVALREFRFNLTQYITRVEGGGERVAITKNGRHVATLVPVGDETIVGDVEVGP